MPYTFYTDRAENFECEVSVKNASLKGSIARLVVETSDGLNLVFNGKIENGKCYIPVRRLKGLLDENSKGNVFLEIIVEDTYFKPWKSEFIVEDHTSVKVQVNESKTPAKPVLNVKGLPTQRSSSNNTNSLIPLYELSQICKRIGIDKSNIKKRKSDFIQLLNEYFNMSPEFVSQKATILKNLKKFVK